MSIPFPPDGEVTIRPFQGAPQPTPVVLFDSGHSELDLHVLNYLHQKLHYPYMTNGGLERNYLKHKNNKKDYEFLNCWFDEIQKAANSCTIP
jgi:hypothetical protein